MPIRRPAILSAFLLFLSLPVVAGVTYTASPADFASKPPVKLKIDVSSPKAIVRKTDGGNFQKAGTMRLYQNGAQIGPNIAYGQQFEVIVPFSWNFTSGSRSFEARAFSSDGSTFPTGTVTVTAKNTDTTPYFKSKSLAPEKGEQNTTQFTWQATAANADGKSFGVTLWIVQPNGVAVAFTMTPQGNSWSSGVTFKFTKNLISAGSYGYYFVAGTTSGPTARYPTSGSFPGPTTNPPPPPPPMLQRPRMSDTVTHAGVHLYYSSATTLRQHLQLIRQTITGSTVTCYQQGNGQQAQLAVQVEFPFSQYAGREAAFLKDLDSAIDTIVSEGFAVHLLLSVHYRPADRKWLGYDWNQSWPAESSFVPYQPMPERVIGTTTCLYDVIAEKFHVPVIKYLIASGRSQQIAVIYLLNEFDYQYTEKEKPGEKWPSCKKSTTLCRNEALAYTTQRVLAAGRTAAGKKVPIGVKFSDFTKASSAYVKPTQPGQGDQLSWLLSSVMSPNGDVLGFDAYWNPNTNLYDKKNYTRLSPFLGGFAKGTIELAEYGRICDERNQQPCAAGIDRTQWWELRDVVKNWPQARGFNLFAFNAGNCYTMTKDGNFCPVGGKTELANLWEQVKSIAGTNPQRCQ